MAAATGWKVPVTTGGTGEAREVCPADQYPAVLVAMIDLGTHAKKEFQKETFKDRHMIALVWEVQGARTSAGEPFYFAEEYPLSLNEKAKFRAVLEMGGAKVADDGDFDITAVLGCPYLLEVEVGTSLKGNEYARIAKNGVAKLPNAMKKGIEKPVRPPFVWQIGQGVLAKHDWIPFLYGKAIHDIQSKSRELAGGAEDKESGGGSGEAGGSDESIPF